MSTPRINRQNLIQTKERKLISTIFRISEFLIKPDNLPESSGTRHAAMKNNGSDCKEGFDVKRCNPLPDMERKNGEQKENNNNTTLHGQTSKSTTCDNSIQSTFLQEVSNNNGSSHTTRMKLLKSVSSGNLESTKLFFVMKRTGVDRRRQSQQSSHEKLVINSDAADHSIISVASPKYTERRNPEDDDVHQKRTREGNNPILRNPLSALHHSIMFILAILFITTCFIRSVESANGPGHSGKIRPGHGTPSPVIPFHHTECLKNRKWWAFMLSSLGTFVAGVFAILIFRAFAFLVRAARSPSSGSQGGAGVAPFHGMEKMKIGPARIPGQSFKNPHSGDAFQMLIGPDGQPVKETSWASEAKDWAGELISGQSTTGRILVVLVFLLSIASLIIYFVDASRIGPSGDSVEKCLKWSESPTQQLDLALNVFFAVYFFIRFVAAADKLWFMLELYSFVDYFTIPPSFVSLYLDRTW